MFNTIDYINGDGIFLFENTCAIDIYDNTITDDDLVIDYPGSTIY